MEEALLIDNEDSFTPPQPVDSSIPQAGLHYHAPVLLSESMLALAVKPNGTYVDCTLGGGGHFQAIVDRLDEGGVAVGIDRDPEAIAWCESHLRRGAARIILRQRKFSHFNEVIAEMGLKEIDGVLLDLGVSSHQIRAEHRGFSYMRETSLDMRMNPADTRTAADILATNTTQELSRLFADYGEIRHPLRMAETIARYRTKRALRTSEDLKQCLRQEYGQRLNIKMLAKLFQALRIAVNDELTEIRQCLEKAVNLLSQGGRLAVISYHSLEDGIVKNFIRNQQRGCVCPPELPFCQCGISPRLKRISKKAIAASDAEVRMNPAARSAHLRVAEKTAGSDQINKNPGQAHETK